jgi:hypothetical protein
MAVTKVVIIYLKELMVSDWLIAVCEAVKLIKIWSFDKVINGVTS